MEARKLEDAPAAAERDVSKAPWVQDWARKVREVAPEAEVYCKREGGVYHLWVVLPERDDEVEGQVAEMTYELVLRYPDVALDFMQILRNSSLFSTLAQPGFVLVRPARPEPTSHA